MVEKIDFSSQSKKSDVRETSQNEIKTFREDKSCLESGASLDRDLSISARSSKKISFPQVELRKIGRCASTYAELHEVNQTVLNQRRNGRPYVGVVGLQNLGNTCFMNSAIQCLSNTPPLTDYFLGYDWSKEINKQNPLGMRGEVASAFGSLIGKIWTGESKYLAPTALREKISKFNPIFSGYQQHDAQELLAFLLDGLHEDLNRVHEKPYIEDVESDGRPDEELAMEAWKGYLQRNRSIIVDLFQGQLRNELRCSKCNHTSLKFDPFMYLSLPVESSRIKRIKRLDLRHCIDSFCQREKIDGDNKWYCPKCKKIQIATKKLDIWKFPAILIIHLKRFQHDKSGRRSKINTLVSFDTEDMDLSSQCISPQKDPPFFDLFAVVNHHGSLGGGHYTAFGKNRLDEKWYQFNDRQCSQASEAEVQSSAAYVLFYSRMVMEPSEARISPNSSRAHSQTENNFERHPAVIRRQTVNKPHLWPHIYDNKTTRTSFLTSTKKSLKTINIRKSKVTNVKHSPTATRQFGSDSSEKRK